MRRNTLICLVAATGLLSACSAAKQTAVLAHPPYSPIAALVAADAVSVINTGKTVEDHVIGWVSGQDCSLIRASHGGDYCVDNTPPPKMVVAAYCYKTLAKTTCYDRKVEFDESTYVGKRVDMVPVASR